MNTELTTPTARFAPVELVIPEEKSLAKDTVTSLRDTFLPLFTDAADLMRQAALVKVESADQLGHMETAKKLGKLFVQLRGKVAQAHKTAKEDSLKKGRCIDAIKNAFLAAVGPAEDYLTQQATFIARKEATEKEALRKDRMGKLAIFSDIIPLPNVDLASLSTDDFCTLLEGTQARHQKEVTRREEDEKAKQAAEKAEREEKHRLAQENEKLRAEQLEKDRVARAERAKADAEMTRLAEEAAEARKKAAADLERQNAEIAAERKKAADAMAELEKAKQKQAAQEDVLPAFTDPLDDAERISHVAGIIEDVRDHLPDMETDAGKEVMKKFHAHLTQSVAWLNKQKATLE